MIGLSLSDPNLRGLLEIAAQKQSKNCRHYAFIQRLSNDSLIDDSSCVKINEENIADTSYHSGKNDGKFRNKSYMV